jgi:tetratricopeptide (TPR) repeat protein
VWVVVNNEKTHPPTPTFTLNLPLNHPTLAIGYTNLGFVYYLMGQYSTALPYYEKAIETEQKYLPSNHLISLVIYVNMGSTYRSLREYPKSLSY